MRARSMAPTPRRRRPACAPGHARACGHPAAHHRRARRRLRASSSRTCCRGRIASSSRWRPPRSTSTPPRTYPRPAAHREDPRQQHPARRRREPGAQGEPGLRAARARPQSAQPAAARAPQRSEVFVTAAESGIGIFEMDFAVSATERGQFQPIAEWVDRSRQRRRAARPTSGQPPPAPAACASSERLPLTTRRVSLDPKTFLRDSRQVGAAFPAQQCLPSVVSVVPRSLISPG